jgi:hypothetical protein
MLKLLDRILTAVIVRLLRLSPVWPAESEEARQRRWEDD